MTFRSRDLTAHCEPKYPKIQTAVLGRTAKNWDISTGPLARPFAHSLAPLTRLLAPDCSLRSRPPLRSLVHSLAHFTHSLARGTVNDWMDSLSVFFSIFDHRVSVTGTKVRRRFYVSSLLESFLSLLMCFGNVKWPKPFGIRTPNKKTA